MNHWLEPQLQAAARQQTSVALNNIVSRIISEMEYDSDKLIDVERDKEGYITSINYDTNALNTLLHDTLETIDESLEACLLYTSKELRSLLLCQGHRIEHMDTMEDWLQLPSHPYESLIRPLLSYLKGYGVQFHSGMTVEDAAFADTYNLRVRALTVFCLLYTSRSCDYKF